MTATINGQPVILGCHIDGHWGQYAVDRLADIAEVFGWQPASTDDDPRALRQFAETADECNKSHSFWEQYTCAADDILDWLNDRAEGCVVMWEDGELFIDETTDDDNR